MLHVLEIEVVVNVKSLPVERKDVEPDGKSEREARFLNVLKKLIDSHFLKNYTGN